ncbi:MAG: TetR/AcrR family transcriptional regulator [Elusimicrobia bacterium]|nr:TetR/AcrR family transcriptional regulator [Elusimicrobiota bacterium]
MTVLERKEREFQQREEAILAAALSLFNRDDWQTVTIDQIAAKAEIGKGTIYKHFESKDQIYAKLVVNFHRNILRELGKIDLSQAPLKVIGETLDVFWRSHGLSPEHKRLVRYCEREDFKRLVGDKLSQELDALDNELNSIIIPVVERGIKEGALIDRPVEHLMLSLHASMVGLVEMDGVECVQTDLTAEQKYQVIKEFALRGISKR